MPPISLTEGAVAMLSGGDTTGHDLKPVLQVADIRQVNTQNKSNIERYRLMLSDGAFMMQGMLDTRRNDLVRSGKIQQGSILHLTQFVCNLVQNRRIIIMVDLDVILEQCDPIGEPKIFPTPADGNVSPVTRSPTPSQPLNQPAAGNSPSSYGAGTALSSSTRSNVAGGIHAPFSSENRNAGPSSYSTPSASNLDPGRFNSSNVLPVFPKTESSSYVSRPPLGNYGRPPQSSYQQLPPMYANRGPIVKNDAAPRIIPIAALNPYQGRWTIKARVTAKGELRHFTNTRGDGKVFSFDLLDSDGGEIRVTCFNAVADQFYQQIEPGRVYMISRGTLKPAQKSFNHLRNDHEITLDNTSTVEPCFEDDQCIPQHQFHFRPIGDIEGLENNTVLDVIAIVTSITPSSLLMRKNGTETQKRALQLKDMSGRSVELTLWGNFCDAFGQTLQTMCDSGVFPVLALKSGRVNDFNGKSVGTISTSQLFIEPDFPEAQKLKAWFENEGKNAPFSSISRDMNMIRTDARKTISQIKDDKLGTSEKPDWITVSATLTFIKVDNFCYTACPIMIGDRQCNRKVTNNGDGKWRCERCDQLVDECDYRYILQMQIQDHTGLTWVTAFQESGEEIMGISAKELYFMKFEEEDDEKFSELMRTVLFTKFIFKLKVKEETFSDEQRVKSTVVKAEKVNFQMEARYLLDMIANLKNEESSYVQPKNKTVVTPYAPTGMASSGVMNSNAPRRSGVSDSQMGSYVNNNNNQYCGGRFNSSGTTGEYMSCTSCGGTGHNSSNCPSLMSFPGQSSHGVGVGNNSVTPGGSGGGVSGECYKCHQIGHWARDCPNNAEPPAYGVSSNVAPGSGVSSECYKCHQIGHWARDCPTNAEHLSYGGSRNVAPGSGSGGVSGECYKCHQIGHWSRDCPNNAAPQVYGNSSNVAPGRYGMPQKQHAGGF